MAMYPSLNVFGEPLDPCGENPLTGFYRDGCCNSSDEDGGSHTVCIEATEEFLRYSQLKGNDLSDKAPRVFLRRTHLRALDRVALDLLKQYAVDLN
jgi:uncharacterized protein (DUF2237 family)